MLNPTSKDLRFLEELKMEYARKKSVARKVEEVYESEIEDEVYRVLPYFTLLIKDMLSAAVQREDEFIFVTYKEAAIAMRNSRSILENMKALINSREVWGANQDDEKIQEQLVIKACQYFGKLGFKTLVTAGPFGAFKSFSLSGWTDEPVRFNR